MEFTKEQELAVRLRGKDILVSAGAGAGKTRVLISRMAEMILDEDNPIPVDSFLVMTFTNAAADEMKERITGELNLRLENDPDNRYLRKQLRMLSHADISTVHSFCNRLIRKHFNVVGIDPSFRIGEEGELFLLKQKAIENVLEEAYQSGRDSFYQLVEAYMPGKDDHKLEELIENMYRFSRGFPDSNRWFSDFLSQAEKLGDSKELKHSVILSDLVNKAKTVFQDLYLNVVDALEWFENENGPERFYQIMFRDKEVLENLQSMEEYDAVFETLNGLSLPNLPQGTKKEKEWLHLEEVKAIHRSVKEKLKELKEKDFFLSLSAICMENKIIFPYLKEMTVLTQEFHELYFQMKKDKNVYDFDDLEHIALDILVDSYDEAGQAIPSQTARELSSKYKTIFVDEYQDTNLVQETIVNLLSDPKKNHLFVVGDVKQSIYRFRQARPDLFLARYHQYQDEQEENGVVIELRDNFRSTFNVLYFCNDIFSHLMKNNFGGIDYNEQVALRPGKGTPMAEFDDLCELMLLIEDEEKENSSQDWNEVEAEAAMIARRIRELSEEGFEYKDIVILARSGTKWSETMEEFLLEAGIPAISENKTGYFQTREIRVVLNYLSVVDNVYQDIPMASVLLSPIGALNEEELTELKVLISPVERGAYPLYDLMKIYLVEGEDDKLKKKLERFLDLLLYFRRRKKEMPLHALLWEIYQKTGIFDAVQLMPEGKKRKENLMMLLQRAEEYEKTVFKGLFYFIRYMEQLKSYEIDLAEASTEDNNLDAVRIMTIHKSKGLEFPVVFLCGMSGKFNLMDGNKQVLFHPDLGVGMEYIDMNTRTHHPSLMKKKIKEQILKETLEEELRILYVAMTRAQRKLILTGSVKEEIFDENYSAIMNHQDCLLAKCYMDWVLPLICCHPDFVRCAAERNAEKQEDETLVRNDQAAYLTIQMVHYHELEEEQRKSISQQNPISLQQLMEQEIMQEDVTPVKNAFEHEYPYQEATMRKRKYSVSELKKLSMLSIPSETDSILTVEENVLSDKIDEVLKPAFLQKEEEEPKGSARGTIVHKIMELLPFGKIHSKEDLFDALEQVKKEYAPAETIFMQPVYVALKEFLFSETGTIIREMDMAGQLYKELPFTVGLSADQIDADSQNQEIVVVQGVIDACGESEDGLWLFDYKTDYISPGEERVLLDRYEKQMLYYKLALEQMMQKKVSHIYIFSFTLNKFIRVKI
ncbi:MAG: helicase-exonuclease AddAB subunit AddA [Lachnospiraceae bacterium]|nr:helicase-exonuclease AddAB subunit AddA [Lachnospiraceae bacterium]